MPNVLQVLLPGEASLFAAAAAQLPSAAPQETPRTGAHTGGGLMWGEWGEPAGAVADGLQGGGVEAGARWALLPGMGVWLAAARCLHAMRPDWVLQMTEVGGGVWGGAAVWLEAEGMGWKVVKD